MVQVEDQPILQQNYAKAAEVSEQSLVERIGAQIEKPVQQRGTNCRLISYELEGNLKDVADIVLTENEVRNTQSAILTSELEVGSRGNNTASENLENMEQHSYELNGGRSFKSGIQTLQEIPFAETEVEAEQHEKPQPGESNVLVEESGGFDGIADSLEQHIGGAERADTKQQADGLRKHESQDQVKQMGMRADVVQLDAIQIEENAKQIANQVERHANKTKNTIAVGVAQDEENGGQIEARLKGQDLTMEYKGPAHTVARPSWNDLVEKETALENACEQGSVEIAAGVTRTNGTKVQVPQIGNGLGIVRTALLKLHGEVPTVCSSKHK
ncbi:hypothetical protein LIER_21778 [Lithospermum erythrorhizon]|uniref:Uncharacterized protein n=1 Tax=Lithospermum erythrorhizon TaxID=34254 RepID=A0AAV3QSH2_LITER